MRLKINGERLAQMTPPERAAQFAKAGFTMAHGPQNGSRAWVSIDTGISPLVDVQVKQGQDGSMEFTQQVMQSVAKKLQQ